MASTRSSVMDEALADVALHGELVALKEAGNAAFRAGSDREAFGHYTAGITRALQANAVCLEAGDGQDSMFQVVATLYSNRAAVGLRLRRYEQVVSDTWRAQDLLRISGLSENVVASTGAMLPVLDKARARRAAASTVLGSVLAAQCEHTKLLENNRTVNREPDKLAARALSQCYVPPVRWGYANRHPEFGPMPPAPPKRCSAAVDGVEVQQLSCRLPKSSAYMQCVGWGGRLWTFGGGHVNALAPRPSGDLSVIDPASGTLAVQRVQADAESVRRFGLPGAPMPRQRHSMVLSGDALYIWGGTFNITGASPAERKAEEETVWRLDLRGEPLRWQRLRCKGSARPALRCSHSAVAWQHSMVVFGGEPLNNRTQELGDAWALDLQHLTWRRLKDNPPPRQLGVAAAAPQPRTEHCAWAWGDWMYVFGGASNNVQDHSGQRCKDFEVQAFTFYELWRLHLRELRWERVHAVGCVPGPLTEAGVAFDAKNGVAYICGGYSTAGFMHVAEANAILQSVYSAELWQFSCANHWWRRLTRADAQPAMVEPAAGTCAAVLDGKLYVAGGYMCSGPEPWPIRTVTSIDPRVCAHCGVPKARAPGGRLQQCSRCREEGRAPVYFCSQACSEAAWPAHKVVCSAKGLLP